MDNFAISPHPKAPLFSHEDGQLVLQQIIREMQSPNPQLENDEVVEVIRQAGYVNLWFFLKGIASYAGPFDLLNTKLHLSMANYRQSLSEPGCRGAMFIPRSCFKTTIVTEGASGWELLRNPDLRIRITGATDGKAEGFFLTIKAMFDSNALIKYLYPEYVPGTGADRWTKSEIVLPNRRKNRREPSLEYGGVGGASESRHYDLHIVDDMIGLASLNSQGISNADMARTRKWFWSSEKTLLQSIRKSRVIVVGTRYAVDDVYDDILGKTYKLEGTEISDFKPNEKGRWRVYYRKALENSQSIFPESFTKEDIEEMLEDDYWTAVTQYMNEPHAAGLTEFSGEPAKKCFLVEDVVDSGLGDKILKWSIHFQRNGEDVDLPLENCDLVQATDPAASETYLSAKTSRSAVGVLATSPQGEHFLISLHVGYVAVTDMINWMFLDKQKFRPYWRGSFLESQGPFKILGAVLRKEEMLRRETLNLRAVTAVGEKTARIRTTLAPVLNSGRLYVEENAWDDFWEEQRSFPQSQKMDILDMLTIALKAAVRPLSQEELWEKRQHERRRRLERHGAAGY